MPFYDEWTMFDKGGLSSTFDLKWLFTLHNENFILTTKLLFWFFYLFNHWDIYTNLLFNFLFFISIVLFFCFLIEKYYIIPSGFLFILFSCILLWENHSWAICAHWHFVIFFFLLALLFLLLPPKYSWFSVIWITLSLFSYGIGIAFSLAYAGLSLYLYQVRKKMHYFILFTVVSLLSVLWFILIWSSHPTENTVLTMPFEPAFWNYFLNLFSLGFGFLQKEFLIGLVYLCFTLALFYFSFQKFKTSKERELLMVVFFFFMGLLGAISLISAGRAKIESVLKTTRYAEITLFFLCVAYILLFKLVQSGQKRVYFGIFILTLVGLFYPFRKHFRFDIAYLGNFYQKRLLKECVKNYYQANDFSKCKDFEYFLTKEGFERAKNLNLSFYQKISKELQIENPK